MGGNKDKLLMQQNIQIDQEAFKKSIMAMRKSQVD